jgi:hypothetical protein
MKIDYKDYSKEEWLKFRPHSSLILAEIDVVRRYKNGFIDILSPVSNDGFYKIFGGYCPKNS